MPEETNVTSVGGATENAPPEKKTRAPRQLKTIAEAAASTSMSAPVKKPRGHRKKVEEGNVLPPVPVATEKVARAKSAEKKQPAKRGPRKVETTAPASDDFADLLKLEEENQKLRKALSDKLRAENAELRKKLGV